MKKTEINKPIAEFAAKILKIYYELKQIPHPVILFINLKHQKLCHVLGEKINEPCYNFTM